MQAAEKSNIKDVNKSPFALKFTNENVNTSVLPMSGRDLGKEPFSLLGNSSNGQKENGL